jgi:hypothetical protein
MLRVSRNALAHALVQRDMYGVASERGGIPIYHIMSLHGHLRATRANDGNYSGGRGLKDRTRSRTISALRPAAAIGPSTNSTETELNESYTTPAVGPNAEDFENEAC